MKVGQAVAQLGIEEPDGCDLIIARQVGSRWQHYTLAECAENEVKKDLFLATGAFPKGAVTRFEGRSEKNVRRILWLPFDFDLADYLNCDKESLWSLSDAELWPLIESLRADVEVTFQSVSLPIHRLDYTGYGLAAAVNLPPHGSDAVVELRRLHKAIVDRINRIWNGQFADGQVSDAGTRIMRLVPCLNTKGAIYRQTKTIYSHGGVVNEAQLRVAAGADGAPGGRVPTRMVPREGKGLDEAATTTLVEALRPSWNSGNRHRLALALGGMLAKAGVPEAQTLAIVEAMDDDEPWDREKAVHTSYERVRTGLDVRGWWALRELLPEHVLTWLDLQLSMVRHGSGPVLRAGGQVTGGAVGRAQAETRSKQWRNEFAPPPDIAFTGWIGDYVELMTPTTEAPPAFHLGVALTIAGQLFGRHVYNQYGTDPLYPNLYTLLVGRSGRTRKDTAIKRATRTLFDGDPQNGRMIVHAVNLATDVGSSTKLIDILKHKQNTLLYVTEFSRLMGNARRQSTDTIIPTLIEAFDTPTVMQNNSMANPIEAVYPFLGILAATQPDILGETMSGTDMNSGFANRWLYICGNLHEPLPLAPVLDKGDVYRLFTALVDAKNAYGRDAALTMEPVALERWREWYMADFYRESPNAEEDAMRARHAVLIQKLALIYAITERSHAITLRHLEVGIAVIEWMWEQMRSLTGSWGRSTDGQIEERIKAVLEKYGSMKKRDLQMKCNSRKWSGVEFSRVFDAMVKNQVLMLIDPVTVALNEA